MPKSEIGLPPNLSRDDAYVQGLADAEAPIGDMPDQIKINGHHFVHVASCPCPRIQAEVARLASHAPDRSIGYTAFECERDMVELGGHCANPWEHSVMDREDVK